MKRLAKWFWLLNKRLYKKPIFLILLVLVLLAAVLLQIAAREDSGFAHIVLVQEDPTDEISSQIVSDLQTSAQLMRYTVCETLSDAISMVENGSADTVWVFEEDMQEKINRFVQTGSKRDKAVTVYVREETVPLHLAQERLSVTLYRYCSSALYISYVRENVPSLDHLTDAQLQTYFDEYDMDGELFAHETPEGEEFYKTQDTGYLMAPLRGLLSVLVLLCAMAATMFYVQDAAAGTFAWVPLQYKPFAAFGSQIIATLNVSVAMLISLYATGIATTLTREIVLVLLYAVCCTLFCMVLHQMFHDIRVYGAIIPLCMVLVIGVCPVFFDLKELEMLQILFPTSYYIKSTYNSNFVWYMVLYAVALAVLYVGLRKLLKRQS